MPLKFKKQLFLLFFFKKQQKKDCPDSHPNNLCQLEKFINIILL
jgi:hypothetical protein